MLENREIIIPSAVFQIKIRQEAKGILVPHEASRRKRTGYQSGLKSDLYLGGHVVSPQTPLPRAYPTASGWGIKKCNKLP